MTSPTKKPRARWGTGRIAVSAKWPDIAAALKERWPLTMIFEKHMDPDKISYSQFRRQVHRLQAAASNQQSSDAPPNQAGQPPPTPQGQTSVRKARFDDHKGIADAATIRKLTSG